MARHARHALSASLARLVLPLEVSRSLRQAIALEHERQRAGQRDLGIGDARALPSWILTQKLACEATVRVGAEALAIGYNILQAQALMDTIGGAFCAEVGGLYAGTTRARRS